MTQEQIISKSKVSPALLKRNKGQFPATFKDRVPLKVKIIKTVVPILFYLIDSSGSILESGNEYYVWVTAYGTVSAILSNGKMVGVKPDEYDVIEWHKIYK